MKVKEFEEFEEFILNEWEGEWPSVYSDAGLVLGESFWQEVEKGFEGFEGDEAAYRRFVADSALYGDYDWGWGDDENE